MTNKSFKTLQTAWNTRCSKFAEGKSLFVKANKPRAKGNKLHAKSYKLFAEANKLYAQGKSLYAEGLRTEGFELWTEGNKQHIECHDQRTKGRKLFAEGKFLWDSTVARCLGSQNSQQIWLCDGTICLLTDGSLWKVPE